MKKNVQRHVQDMNSCLDGTMDEHKCSSLPSTICPRENIPSCSNYERKTCFPSLMCSQSSYVSFPCLFLPSLIWQRCTVCCSHSRQTLKKSRELKMQKSSHEKQIYSIKRSQNLYPPVCSTKLDVIWRSVQSADIQYLLCI